MELQSTWDVYDVIEKLHSKFYLIYCSDLSHMCKEWIIMDNTTPELLLHHNAISRRIIRSLMEGSSQDKTSDYVYMFLF